MKEKLLYIILILIFSSCTGSNSGRIQNSPIPFECQVEKFIKIHNPPYCINSLIIPYCVGTTFDDGFNSTRAFNRCKLTMSCYEDRLNDWLRCFSEKANIKIEEVFNTVKNKYECAKSIKNYGNNNLCIEDPDYIKKTISGSYSFPRIPECIRRVSGYVDFFSISKLNNNYSPINSFGFLSCDNALIEYKRKLEKWRDDEIYKTKKEAENDLNEAIKKFNCKASRKKYCF